MTVINAVVAMLTWWIQAVLLLAGLLVMLCVAGTLLAWWSRRRNRYVDPEVIASLRDRVQTMAAGPSRVAPPAAFGQVRRRESPEPVARPSPPT